MKLFVDVWKKHYLTFLPLLHFPDVVGFEKLREVMVLLLGRDLSKLGMYGIVVGRSLHVADHTESDGEAILGRHHGKLQLQGVVLAVGIVDEYIVDGVSILANLYHLQTEALLHESELVVLTEDELLAMLYVDSILLTAFLIIYGLVATIVEDDTVLQYLRDAGTFVLVGSLQYLDSTLGISCYATGKEVTAGTEAELGRTERILDSAVGA